MIAWKRIESIKTLLQQLSIADYRGWNRSIDLYFHIDGNGSEDVISICKKFHWKYGKKILDIRTKNNGLRNMWITALTDAAHIAGNNTIMLILEDDIRVSNHFFRGLLEMIKKYANSPDCRNINLMGFSLSPIKVEELGMRIKPWNAFQGLGRNNNRLFYLSNVPSSWAAAYFSDRWLEFSEFVEIRSKKPFFNPDMETFRNRTYRKKALDLPSSRSNTWTASWKRFMVDFMFGRGLTMLYPCFPDQQGFATTLQLKGVHVANVSNDYVNPFVAKLLQNFSLAEKREIPSFHELDVFDLHLRRTTQEKLVFEGLKFLQKIRSKCREALCQNLFQSWARPELPVVASGHSPVKICIADVYMTVATSKFRKQKEQSEKYLLLDQLFEKNINFADIKNSLGFAKVIARKLILPRNSQIVKFCEQLDCSATISAFDEKLKNITHNFTLPQKRILRISPTKKFYDFQLILADFFPADMKFYFVDLSKIFSGKSAGDDELEAFFGGCMEDFLIIEGFKSKYTTL